MAVVESDEVGKALTASKAAAFLEPFVGRSRSVSEAAARLGETQQKVHYWVNRLQRLGLLQLTSVTARKGRPIRHYRATSDRFLIPAERVPVGYFRATAIEQAGLLQRALEGAQPGLVHDSDVLVSFGDDGAVSIDRVLADPSNRVLDDNSAAVLHNQLILRLTSADAKQLQRDLWTLVQQYQGNQGAAGDQTYVLQLGLAPLPRD